MKLLCALLLLTLGCSGNTPDPTVGIETTSIAFSVEGMHCEACVDAITASVMQVKGVSQCNVSLEEKKAVVFVEDPAIRVTILEVIRSLKFDVASIDQ